MILTKTTDARDMAPPFHRHGPDEASHDVDDEGHPSAGLPDRAAPDDIPPPVFFAAFHGEAP
jgi:hypothetical protein